MSVDLDGHLAGDPTREADFLATVAAVRTRADDDIMIRFADAITGLVRGQVAWDTEGRVPGVWPNGT